jgi:hypothetical protein
VALASAIEIETEVADAGAGSINKAANSVTARTANSGGFGIPFIVNPFLDRSRNGYLSPLLHTEPFS